MSHPYRGGRGGYRGGSRIVCNWCHRNGHTQSDCSKWVEVERLRHEVNTLLSMYNELAVSVDRPRLARAPAPAPPPPPPPAAPAPGPIFVFESAAGSTPAGGAA
ncbi:hypothetical protein FPOAC1_005002 [Fusarium poae]|uniref:hypothetical protein n=1 Tax=Fusarium poae TaxID=36050 RepID=UPI001CE72C88|nr:hypothetical protein FPOAC1_005002 [Fusarium poae]KAG8671745.1 hypothetical protein FPOAC1_005002 [Fusarium poae]